MEGSPKNVKVMESMTPVIDKCAPSNSDGTETKMKNSSNHWVEESFVDPTVVNQIKTEDVNSGNMNSPSKSRTTSTPRPKKARRSHSVLNNDVKISTPSECLGYYYTKNANGNVLVLSLAPSGQIAVKGMFYVKCLLGSVFIAGYKLRQGFTVPVFAPSPEASILIQGPDAVTMTRNPKIETQEGHWVNFSPKEAEKNQEFKSNIGDIFVMHEKIPMCEQLMLKVGQSAVVIQVSQFPLSSSLQHVLRACTDGVLGDFEAVCKHAPNNQPSVMLGMTTKPIENKQFMESLYFPFSWRQVAASVCSDHSRLSRCHDKSGIRVMVIGGKGVGRSTFTRYLVNSLLNSSSMTTFVRKTSHGQSSDNHGSVLSATKRRPVYVMDLDPRHTEQSLPGTLSCARHIAPLLGPGYVYGVAHALRRRTSKHSEWRGSHYSELNNLDFENNPLELPEIVKEFLLGREDLTWIAEEYMAATAVLVDAYRSQCDGQPLVVNCSSADNSLDFRNTLEVMRLVNPTHVVHIEGKINQEAGVALFNCDRANEELNRPGRFNCDITGVYSCDTDPDKILPVTKELSYVYARIPSVVKSTESNKMREGYRHDFLIAMYFSALWPHFSPTIESDYVQRSIVAYPNNFALHVRHGGVHYSELLNSINCAGLVTLCFIDPKHIRMFGDKKYSIVEIQPRGSLISEDTSNTMDDDWDGCDDPPRKRLKTSAVTLKMPPFKGDSLFRVHGWALVKGVDPKDKTIHLLIPGCASVLNKINCLVQSDIQLPRELGIYRGHKNRPYVSFAEQGSWNTNVKQRTNKKR